jgi:hypothetical protein
MGSRPNLIWISAREYVNLLMQTGRNYPSQSTYEINAKGQYDVWTGEGLPLRRGHRRTSKVRKS